MYKNFNRFILSFVKLTGIPAAYLFFKPKKYFMSEKIKAPCIFMSNHTSLMDMMMYMMIFPQHTIRFLIAEVMYNKGKLFSWFLDRLGGIRVDRNNLTFGFISRSVEILEHGGIVGIFPEARLPVGGKPFPFKPSVVIIALQSGAPIIPVYTDGNYGFLKRANVVIGEKIYLRDMCDSINPDKQELERLTLYLRDTVYSLKKQVKA